MGNLYVTLISMKRIKKQSKLKSTFSEIGMKKLISMNFTMQFPPQIMSHAID